MDRLSINRQQAARLTFGFALALYLHRYLTHSLLHQLQQPRLFLTEFDYTYWLYQASGFPAIFVQTKTGAWIFDIVLLISTALNCMTGGSRRPVVLLSALGWLLYGLTYNSYSFHHNHTMTGIMVLPFAFLAKKDKSFQLAWDAFRYFCCYVYADAFINKAFIGQNIFHFLNGAEFIKTNQNFYMIAHPDSLLTRIYRYFITHPALAYAGFLGMVIMQGLMIIGFFTKKWDRFLFFLPIIFHTVTWLFIDVFFYELLVLNLTLLPLLPAGKKGKPAQKAENLLQIGPADPKDIPERIPVVSPESRQIVAQR